MKKLERWALLTFIGLNLISIGDLILLRSGSPTGFILDPSPIFQKIRREPLVPNSLINYPPTEKFIHDLYLDHNVRYLLIKARIENVVREVSPKFPTGIYCLDLMLEHDTFTIKAYAEPKLLSDLVKYKQGDLVTLDCKIVTNLTTDSVLALKIEYIR